MHHTDDYLTLWSLLGNVSKDRSAEVAAAMMDPEYEVLDCNEFCCHLCDWLTDSYGKSPLVKMDALS